MIRGTSPPPKDVADPQRDEGDTAILADFRQANASFLLQKEQHPEYEPVIGHSGRDILLLCDMAVICRVGNNPRSATNGIRYELTVNSG